MPCALYDLQFNKSPYVELPNSTRCKIDCQDIMVAGIRFRTLSRHIDGEGCFPRDLMVLSGSITLTDYSSFQS